MKKDLREISEKTLRRFFGGEPPAPGAMTSEVVERIIEGAKEDLRKEETHRKRVARALSFRITF